MMIGKQWALAVLALFGVAFGGVASARAAGLLDGSVSITNNFPDLGTILHGPASGPTAGGINLVGFQFNFTADTFTYIDCCDAEYFTFGPGGFNGFVLDFTGIPTIANVSNDPASPNDPTAISFTGDSIDIAFNGGPEVVGAQSILDVAFVPEPESFALLAIGLIGAAALRQRRAVAQSWAGAR